MDFAILRLLAPDSIPQVSPGQSINWLHAGLTAMGFGDRDFRSSPCTRLKTLERHMAAGRLGADLRCRFRAHG